MSYNYTEGKKKILNILSSKTKIEEVNTIPSSESEFTYENGIKSWVGAMFIDIVNSSKLFKEYDSEKIARIMRAFCSEIIEILKANPNYRQIGIRGDCVYAIYSAPLKSDLNNILDDAVTINTFQIMFNKLLQNNSFPPINIGIGLGASKDLIIKAGKKGSGISDNIWIGSAVVDASKLSSVGNRNGFYPIVLDSIFYSNIKDFKANDTESNEDLIFKKYSHTIGEDVYHCNMVKIEFEKWIEGGMRNE